MAVVNGIIVETGQAITVELPTARHPELPLIDDIADDDIFTLYDKSENKTKAATTDQVRAKINGAAVESPPVLSGADMEIEVPEELVGQTRIDIPALAGYTYWLERIGSGRMWSTWYNVLSTGGFELTRDEDKFWEGDKFVAHIYELEGGNTSIPGNTGGGTGLIKGILTVTSNYTITDSDMGKLINSSGGSSKLVHTLDDVENITENSTVDIITMVNNHFQTTIQTTNGQYIYINGTGVQKAYLGIGESLKLARGDDGWYAMGPVLGYLKVGQPFSGFKQVLNSLISEGQLLNREDYPRLWEFAQSVGASLITDENWLSGALIGGNPARRGCFSTGDGTTTFRIPDLRGTTARWLDRGRGFDQNPRDYTMAGSYQADFVKDFLPSNDFDLLLKKSGGGPHETAATYAPGGERPPSWPNITTSMEISGLQPEQTVKSTGLLGLIGC